MTVRRDNERQTAATTTRQPSPNTTPHVPHSAGAHMPTQGVGQWPSTKNLVHIILSSSQYCQSGQGKSAKIIHQLGQQLGQQCVGQCSSTVNSTVHAGTVHLRNHAGPALCDISNHTNASVCRSAWMVCRGAPVPLEHGRPCGGAPGHAADKHARAPNMRCPTEHAPAPYPPHAPDQRRSPAKCPRLPRHNQPQPGTMRCAVQPRSVQTRTPQSNKHAAEQVCDTATAQGALHTCCWCAAHCHHQPPSTAPCSSPPHLCSTGTFNLRRSARRREKPADDDSGGSFMPGWFMRWVEPWCHRDQRGPLLQPACCLHAVQLLLNVRGDGLDLCTQLLLNLVPASTARQGVVLFRLCMVNCPGCRHQGGKPLDRQGDSKALLNTVHGLP
jgi:hypothetical protein